MKLPAHINVEWEAENVRAPPLLFARLAGAGSSHVSSADVDSSKTLVYPWGNNRRDLRNRYTLILLTSQRNIRHSMILYDACFDLDDVNSVTILYSFGFTEFSRRV